MDELTQDIVNFDSLIKSVYDTYEVVSSNKNRCSKLLDRCKLFESPLIELLKQEGNLRIPGESIKYLNDAIVGCLNFVSNYGQKSLSRDCLNVDYCKYLLHNMFLCIQ